MSCALRAEYIIQTNMVEDGHYYVCRHHKPKKQDEEVSLLTYDHL